MIIDGYNAIGKTRALEAKKDISLEAARMSFIALLRDFMARKDMFDRIFVVFDSKEETLGVRRHSYGNVDVLFGTKEKDADAVIVDILRDASPADRISVSSDDNFVRNHTRVFGGDVVPVDELKRIIMLKKQALGGRIKEKDLKADKVRDINKELEKHWGLG